MSGILLKRKLNRWKVTPEDVVILHGFPPAKTLPNMSPFVLKLETYLRLAELNYQWDRKDFFGPKGKSPWISLNGKHITDSELIIQHLGKKFDKNFSKDVPAKQLATARVVRTMLEEYFFCVIVMERMTYGEYKKMKVYTDMPYIFYYYLKRMFKKRFIQQGIGTFSQEEVTDIMTKNLKAVSAILGDKQFFGGEIMCEDDCGIFGSLAQCVWALPDSPYETLMNGECSNLKEYCLRVKDKLWPDWDTCLAKAK